VSVLVWCFLAADHVEDPVDIAGGGFGDRHLGLEDVGDRAEELWCRELFREVHEELWICLVLHPIKLVLIESAHLDELCHVETDFVLVVDLRGFLLFVDRPCFANTERVAEHLACF